MSEKNEIIEKAIKEKKVYTLNDDFEMFVESLGYRKISEKEIVVKKEDYDYLINDCQRWEKLAVEKVDEIIKQRKRIIEKFSKMIKEETKNGIYPLYDGTVDEIAQELATENP